MLLFLRVSILGFNLVGWKGVFGILSKGFGEADLVWGYEITNGDKIRGSK